MLALLLLALPAACAGPTGEAEIVARYEGGTVERHEYESWLAFKGVDDEPAKRLGFAEKIALTEAYAEQARLAGLDRAPSVRLQLDALERSTLTGALRRHVANQIVVPEEEIERRLEEGRDKLSKPRKVRLRNLFKQVPADAEPAEWERARREIEQLRDRLLAGEEFERLAEEESDSLSRHRGGRLGAIEPGQLLPEIERVAFALEPGEVSEIIETEAGLTLLRCDAVIEPRTLTDEEARERIRSFQTRRRAERAWRALREQLVGAAEIVYDLERIRDAATPADAAVARLAGRDVTLRELERLLRSRRNRRGPAEADEASLRAALEELAFAELAAQRARELGLDEDAAVRSAIAWGSAEVLLTEEVRRRVEEEFVPLTEEELRSFFEANRTLLRQRPEYDLSVIRIPVDPASPRREALLAEEILSSLRSADSSFAEAARRHSEHPSADGGGRLGWVSRRRVAALGPAVLRTVSDLRPGETSGVVLQDRNLWLLRLHDATPARDPEFEEVAPEVERRLGTRRGNELAADIEGRLIEELEVRLVGAI